MRKIIVLLSLFYSIVAIANDGTYYSYGGVFYPINDTTISIKKETLSFHANDSSCQVDVRFEFLNPDSSDKTVWIGFQAPSNIGGMSDSISNVISISNYMVMFEGEILPYKLKGARRKTGVLKEIDSVRFSPFSQGIYVYLSEVTFKPEINVVNHSYTFTVSSSTDFRSIYRYILTTGATWAGGLIEEFNVQINMGSNKHFYINDVFGDSAIWNIVGIGRLSAEKYEYGDFYLKMVRIISGYLQIEVKNFQPTQNLQFGVWNGGFFKGAWFEDKSILALMLGTIYLSEYPGIGIDDLDSNEQQYLKNMIYAMHGYVFEESRIQRQYEHGSWYIANPNLKISEIQFSKTEKKLLDQISQVRQ